FKYSASLVVNILRDTLKKDIEIIRDFNGNFENYHTLYSIHVDSMYKRMMEVSDNFIAEQILMMASQSLSDTLSSDIAIDHMLNNYLLDLPDEPQRVDGSGLSRYNLATLRDMISLLLMMKVQLPQSRLFHIS